VIAASGNRLMQLVFAAMNESVRKLMEKRLTALPVQEKEKMLAEHGAIHEAIRDGDAHRAAAMVRRHLLGFYAPMLPAAEARRFDAYIQALAEGPQTERRGAKKH
jgi:DNA-binding FadR family transcriptional regulator